MHRIHRVRVPASNVVIKSNGEFHRRDFVYPTAPDPADHPHPEPDEIAPVYSPHYPGNVWDGEGE